MILRNMRPVAATPRRQFITLSARTVERLRVAVAVVGVLALWAGLFAGSPVVMAVATGVGLAGVLAPSAEKGGEK